MRSPTAADEAPSYRSQVKVVVGLVVCAVGVIHLAISPRYHGPFRPFVTGYLIDVLLPFALFLSLGLFERTLLRSALVRAFLVFGIGAAGETLQGFGVHLAGSTFDPLDFVAYAFGVSVAAFVETLLLCRRE